MNKIFYLAFILGLCFIAKAQNPSPNFGDSPPTGGDSSPTGGDSSPIGGESPPIAADVQLGDVADVPDGPDNRYECTVRFYRGSRLAYTEDLDHYDNEA